MKFSIVIPVAPERNAEILESLKNLDYPKKEFHVIVIKGKNPSENRNKGAKKAKGEIIGFLDDDGILEKDFLKNVEGFFKKYPWIDIVGGPQLTPKNEKGFAKISGYALASKFGASGTANRYKKGELTLNADEKLITSANLFVKKQVMEKIKFDMKLFPGEDPKFIEDARKTGFKVAYSPDFVIYHRRRPTIGKLMKQIFNYGKVRPLKERFIKTLKKPIFLIPSLFVIYLIISSVFLMLNIYPYIFIIPLIIYLILNLLFSIFESIKNKDLKAVFILPLIFSIIHISYGTGMIYGWIKKLLENKNI